MSCPATRHANRSWHRAPTGSTGQRRRRGPGATRRVPADDEERLLRAVEQGRDTCQRGTDDERDEEEEGERKRLGPARRCVPGARPRFPPRPRWSARVVPPRRGSSLPGVRPRPLCTNEQGNQADDGGESPPAGPPRRECWRRFAASRPHKAFEPHRELMGDLLPIEHQPDHAHEKQHQWREGQGGVVGQPGRQPQAVVVDQSVPYVGPPARGSQAAWCTSSRRGSRWIDWA